MDGDNSVLSNEEEDVDCFSADLFISEDYTAKNVSSIVPALSKEIYTRLRVWTLPATVTAYDLTGQLIWPAATALSIWLAGNPGAVEGKRCVELGAGPGLCGLVAAATGARSMIFTDGDDTVCRLLQKNVEENGQHLSDVAMSARKLFWTLDAADVAEDVFGGVDVIIGADVVFWESHIDPLLETIIALLSLPRQVDQCERQCILAYVHRYDSVTSRLKSSMQVRIDDGRFRVRELYHEGDCTIYSIQL